MKKSHCICIFLNVLSKIGPFFCLFSWEVFTVISRKILFFWEKCHFEKNPIFFRKRQDFLPIFPVWTQPILWVILIYILLYNNCFLIGLSPRIPRNPCTEKCTLKRLEMAQNEKVFCDESLNRRRYRLGVKKQNVALDETFQMSLLGAS